MDRHSAASLVTTPLLSRPGALEIFACSITAIAYLGTLAFGFVYDDIPQILKNPALQAWHYVPQYFTSHVWAAIYPNTAGNYYRPLFLLWLRINYALFGVAPAGWHAASILCHVVATLLVFRIARQLSHERVIGFTAALFFGLHPAHIENVAWISGVTDPLMACFVLASCSAFLSFRESRQGFHLAASLGWFALALLSKETAIVLPALILVLSLIRTNKRAQPAAQDATSPATAIAWIAPYTLLTLIYIGVRYRVLHGFTHPMVAISWAEVLLSWPSVLWFYARHLFFPFSLSEFYVLDYVRHFTAVLVLWPLLLLGALALAMHYWIRALPQKEMAWFSVALIVLPLLPVLDLRSLTMGDIVHDRYLYLPGVGFALLAALTVVDIGQRLPQRQRIIVPAALTTALALLFAFVTVTEQTQWASDILLYTRGVQWAPDNLTVRDNLANALLDANQPQRAIPLYLDVLKRNPNFWRSNYNLGYAYYKTGSFAAAEGSLQRAIQIDSRDPDQYIYLAIAELQLKKFADGAENARRAIARNPQGRGYHFVLGLICEAQDDRNAAIAAFETELAEHPDNAPAQAELQKVERASAKPRP